MLLFSTFLLLGNLLLARGVPLSVNESFANPGSLANQQDGISGRVAAPPPPGASPNRGQVLFPSNSGVVASGIQANPGVQAAGIQANAGRLPFPSPVTINVGDNSQLFVPPGSTGILNIVLRNDGLGSSFLISGADDKAYFQGFQTSQLGFLPTGQTVTISGRIAVPPYSPVGTVSKLTVYVQRLTDSSVSQRLIYITAKSEPIDNYNPRVYILSSTRCDEYLQSSLCTQRLWSFRAEISDPDSGLRSVALRPDGRFINEDFPVGTNQSIVIDYSASCCTTSVDIIATDVRGRTETYRMDANAIRLGGGEIAAIVLAIILLILLIVLAIVLICRCMRRRKSVKTAPPVPKSKGRKKDRQ